MNVTKFEVRKNYREVSKSEKGMVAEGCTLEQDDQVPEVIESYDNKEAALEALKKYATDIYNADNYIGVTEFYVEENEYDEDGDWVAGGDAWAFTEMPACEL